jgi:hypothetical protein
MDMRLSSDGHADKRWTVRCPSLVMTCACPLGGHTKPLRIRHLEASSLRDAAAPSALPLAAARTFLWSGRLGRLPCVDAPPPRPARAGSHGPGGWWGWGQPAPSARQDGPNG